MDKFFQGCKGRSESRTTIEIILTMVTLREEKRKANKEHNCNWCGLTIKKGEVYDNSAHVYDGMKYTWKNHLSCMELAHKLKMFDGDPVGEDHFRESIFWAYKDILIEKGIKIDSRFDYHSFEDQIKMVKEKHLKTTKP